MATCEEADSSSDQITQLCNLCCKNVSDGYCVECEDFMCQSCFNIHIRVRTCRHHVLIDDVNHPNFNKKTFAEQCKKHPNQVIEFYCVDHLCVGCVRCFFPEHRICHYEKIEDSARRFKTRGEDKRLMEELQRLESTHDKYAKQNEIDTETAATVNEKTVKDMRSFTDRIISYAENVRREVLERSERLLRENETRLEKRLAELDGVANEIETIKVKLDNKDNLEKLFIESTEISPILKDLKQKMTSFEQHVTMEYEFRPNKQIFDILNNSKSFGEICIMSGKSTSGKLNESHDSDGVEVIDNDNEDDQNTNGNFASVSHPIPDMLEHSSLHIEEKEVNSADKISQKGTKEDSRNKETAPAETDDAHLNTKTGHVAAARHTEDPPAVKTKAKFTLKRLGKNYIIKSDACSKPFKYTPKSEDVDIDEDDDLLCDGEDIYKLTVVNGTIRIDTSSNALTVDSTASTMNRPRSQSSPNKTNGSEQAEDNKAHIHDGGANSSKSGPANNDAMGGTANSMTTAEVVCEPCKLSNKNIFCLSGTESNNLPKICVQTYHTKQPSKITLYSFGCENIRVFLRWTIALRNKSLLKQISTKYKNVDINSPNDVLVIEDPDRKYCNEETTFDFVSNVIDYIIGITKNYKSEGISLDGDDVSTILSAIRKLQVSQDQQIVEYYDKDEDVLWILFHSSQRKQLKDIMDKAREKTKSTEEPFVETLTLTFFWHKILNEQQFVDDFERSHKNVTIIQKMVEDNDSVIVTVQSDCKEDAMAAKTWIQSKEQNYASNIFSYKPLNVPHHFEASVVLDEFLRRSFEEKDVGFVRNDRTQMIWIWSESMRQGDLDKERNKVKKIIEKNEVIKTLSLYKSKRVTTVMEKLGFSKDSAFVKIIYRDKIVTLSGLCQIVYLIIYELNKA